MKVIIEFCELGTAGIFINGEKIPAVRPQTLALIELLFLRRGYVGWEVISDFISRDEEHFPSYNAIANILHDARSILNRYGLNLEKKGGAWGEWKIKGNYLVFLRKFK